MADKITTQELITLGIKYLILKGKEATPEALAQEIDLSEETIADYLAYIAQPHIPFADRISYLDILNAIKADQERLKSNPPFNSVQILTAPESLDPENALVRINLALPLRLLAESDFGSILAFGVANGEVYSKIDPAHLDAGVLTNVHLTYPFQQTVILGVKSPLYKNEEPTIGYYCRQIASTCFSLFEDMKFKTGINEQSLDNLYVEGIDIYPGNLMDVRISSRDRS